MADDLKQKGERIVNRLVIGVLFLILFGIAGGLAIYLLGVPLSGDVGDLLAGLDALTTDIGTGIATIVWWVVSTLIIAGIAIILVGRMTFFLPFKKAEQRKPDIPKKITIVTAIILGATISLLFFLVNVVLGIFGTDLSAGSLEKLATAFTSGDIATIFLGIIFAIVVGVIVVGIANRTGSAQKVAETAGIDKV